MPIEYLLLSLFIFILGTIVGSFLNVLIDRLPKDESIMGRSHCDYCKHILSPLDLIPLVSFFLLNRKCRYCGKKLSWQYPAIELLTGISFVVITNFQFSIFNEVSTDRFSIDLIIVNWSLIVNWLLKIGILCCLIVIFFTDLKKRIIPDEMQAALFIIAFLIKVWQGVTLGGLGYALIEGTVVMLPILLLHLITRGRGMGFGDVKLAFNIGFLLGIKAGLIVLYLGFITGAIFGIALLILKKKKMKSKIAFGPFLVAGMFVLIFFQEPVFRIIHNIYGI